MQFFKALEENEIIPDEEQLIKPVLYIHLFSVLASKIKSIL